MGMWAIEWQRRCMRRMWRVQIGEEEVNQYRNERMELGIIKKNGNKVETCMSE